MTGGLVVSFKGLPVGAVLTTPTVVTGCEGSTRGFSSNFSDTGCLVSIILCFPTSTELLWPAKEGVLEEAVLT